MNKATWSWHAAAGCFAYGYGTLAQLQYKYVGQDQLIGGTWPDNEPAVSCMDWQSGQVNAKYYVTRLLAKTVGSSEQKTLFGYAAVDESPPVPVGFTAPGTCGITGYGGDCDADESGAFNTTTEKIGTLAQCVSRVAACKRGSYASFSLTNEDCSCERLEIPTRAPCLGPARWLCTAS